MGPQFYLIDLIAHTVTLTSSSQCYMSAVSDFVLCIAIYTT